MLGLPFKIPGLSGSPRAALLLLLEKVESTINKPVNHLIMGVDYKDETIEFTIPEYSITEKMSNAFLFMIISAAMKAEFSTEVGDVDIVALVIDFKKEGKSEGTIYYFKDGEKLFSTKQI